MLIECEYIDDNGKQNIVFVPKSLIHCIYKTKENNFVIQISETLFFNVCKKEELKLQPILNELLKQKNE